MSRFYPLDIVELWPYLFRSRADNDDFIKQNKNDNTENMVNSARK